MSTFWVKHDGTWHRVRRGNGTLLTMTEVEVACGIDVGFPWVVAVVGDDPVFDVDDGERPSVSGCVCETCDPLPAELRA